MGTRTGKRTLEVGDPAPEIRLPDADGVVRSLGEFLSSGTTLVVLFKVSCPTCQFTLPFLGRLGGGRMPVIGISQDDAEWTREFSREFGVSFPILLDSEDDGYPVSEAFGITHVPSLFVIAPDRTITWTGTGFGRRGMEELGEKAGVAMFRPGENAPEWKAG